jgi:uncharacterized repeat protein (TIGR04138 family)
MPQTPKPTQKPAIEPAVDISQFPPHAYAFVQEGLDYTVGITHGPEKPGSKKNRHVTGQQLCEGLGELARAKWGRMARTVLRRWNMTSTFDFGRIVYAMIEMKEMQKVEEDSIDDFRDVYDFETAFETGYRIPSQNEQEQGSR